MDNKIIASQKLVRQTETEVVNISQIYEKLLKKSKQPLNRLDVLYELALGEVMTQGQLAQRINRPKQTINNIITKMQQEGLVDLTPLKTDGRKKVISLTKKGRIAAAKDLDFMFQVEDRLVDAMGTVKMQQLIELEREYAKNLQTIAEEF
ncbi:transcriptional regulator, MarR family [Ligilactobacillus sp. WC1T17]|uniref:Transcriptional regulator, MarR family n=1 Tax=Ligilactobacillus ruminis TaxID=1623 RepID=A0ABY1AEL5_9LACO|nr:transcriptional regulator, MarR family [Ligilactobacillus ruminis]